MFRRWLPPLFFILSCLGISWLSYTFVDRNLILINQPFFVSWQNWMWQIGLNTPIQFQLFLVFTTSLTLSYFALLRSSTGTRAILGISTLILLLGHNSYSRDIYNYIFNAKMVAVYHENPHVSVALDFASDTWTRFMHNIHTPAPYGYGWTVLSLLPFSIGVGKFITTYFAFKLFMVIGWGITLWCIWQLLKESSIGKSQRMNHWMLFAFHPLVLTETLLIGHNDVWMMWPALTSWLFLHRSRSVKSVLLATLLMAFSISIKFATVLLIPLLIIEVLPYKNTFFSFVRKNWAELSALLLMVPLLTLRSQQFHPWYLIWSLCFLPLIQWRWLKWGLLGLSITSLFRYAPWIMNALEYTPQILIQQKIVTWSGFFLGIIVSMLQFPHYVNPRKTLGKKGH